MTALTIEQKIEVRKLYSTGKYTYKDLAKKYYVSVSTIGKIIRNEPKEELRKFGGYFRTPVRHKEPMRRKFNKKEMVIDLIETVSEYALMDNWSELYLIEVLLSCGLVRSDFEDAGYEDFYEEYFGEAV